MLVLTPSLIVYFAKNGRAREASVTVLPDWNMLEEIEFHRLAKLRLEVDDPEDLYVTPSESSDLNLRVCSSAIHMAVSSPTIKHTIVLPRRPRSPFNWWIVSSTIQQPRTIQSCKR